MTKFGDELKGFGKEALGVSLAFEIGLNWGVV